MNCEKNCVKKYNPDGKKKINPYVARELWECQIKCDKKKSSKSKKNNNNKIKNSKKKQKKKKTNKRKKSTKNNYTFLERLFRK